MKTSAVFAACKPFFAAGTPVLTPTLRLARALRADWAAEAEAHHRIATSPTVNALGAWLEGQWMLEVEAGTLPMRRVLSPAEAEEVWLTIVTEDLADNPGFSLLQPMAAARLAQRTRETLLQHNADPTRHAADFDTDADCRRFYRWLQRFERRLNDGPWLTQSDLERALTLVDGPRHESAVLLNPEDTSPLSRAALGTLVAQVEVIELPDPAIEPAAATHKDPASERTAAATWAAARYRRGQGSSALVVVDLRSQRAPLETALREAFDARTARYDALPVNFSRGVEFAAAPMYRDALILLGVLQGSVTRRDILALARSPYLDCFAGHSRERRVRFIRDVFRLGADPIAPITFRTQLGELGGCPLHTLLVSLVTDRRLQRKQSGSTWRSVIIDCLEQVSWPARSDLDSYEYQQREQLDELLDAFEAALGVHGATTFNDALGVLTRVLQRRQFQPVTPDDAIQVLSPREARGLEFDGVWLLGAQSNLLPQRPEWLPFVPGHLQRRWQLPSVVDPEGTVAATRFLQGLMAQSGTFHISWHKQVDGVEQLVSPLIARCEAAGETEDPVLHRWRQGVAEDAELIAQNDVNALPLSVGLEPTKGGSALLRDQALCPFKGWAAHRLRVRGLEDVASGLSPVEKGIVLHRVMQLVWNQLQDSGGLQARAEVDLSDDIASAAEQALRELEAPVRQRVGTACLAIEAGRLQRVVGAWLAFERDRPMAFQVVATEEARELVLGDLVIKLVVDRIDQLEDGRLLVIDYKSSDRFKPGHWWGDRVREPQLPSYALAESRAEAIAWAVIKGSQPQLVSLGRLSKDGTDKPLGKQLRDDAVEDWQAVRTGWQTRLEHIAAEFLSGDARVSPQPGACRYCDYRPVCRVDDVAVETLLELDE